MGTKTFLQNTNILFKTNPLKEVMVRKLYRPTGYFLSSLVNYCFVMEYNTNKCANPDDFYFYLFYICIINIQ